MAGTSYRRRRPRDDDGAEPEFQVAPMADLLFVLLVFFMSITTVEVLRTDRSVRLPVAKESRDRAADRSRARTAAHQLIANVSWDAAAQAGAVSIDERRFPAPVDPAAVTALTALLASRAAADPALRVLIRADRAADYASVAALLRACGQAGIADVAFAVLDGERPRPVTALPPPMP